ncbi:MAG: type II toxin-antitoxin system VapC family toxin [Lentisphaerae bacterium]|nr:type II toxin-antitoxin system VapC family toxin [Lentisphaerota bacterium]MBT4816147.1 type II toxin-antitoxin system VapC family toxin [Lentisphaerota bacterium]MBT5605262.1 type II toxin-antitoxin system VapC family toxin [Lentisphaerota bacterium]MBT7059241.1 type II toxin-antitoxin system VapC family toxin [Lentisphaerota bacterium]MBT7844596.1 type II toxin-antitoxin system VapC family toxin [Lentisphaerota bacterium]
MIALDTNVIIRFLVRDDEVQAQAVYARFRQAETARETLFIPLLVLLETIWVLGSAYRKTRSEILSSIEDMKRMPIFVFERDEVVQGLLLEGRRSRADLADILIACSAQNSGCEEGITFDKKASKLAFFRPLRSRPT